MAPDFRSKKEVVYDFLREEIITGNIKPKSRLVIDELAVKLKVSQIPIREAIQQLEADGFVVTEPYVGATVTDLDANFIFEVFALLEAMEVICSRSACHLMTDAQLETLTEMVDAMDLTIESPSLWGAQNREFHLFISECAHTQLTLKMMRKIFDHWDRLRLHYLKNVPSARVAEAQKQHHEMLVAFKERDAEQVEQIMREHNQSALKSYIQHLRSEGYLVMPERE